MRLTGEDILQDDPLKMALYPRADRAIVDLNEGHYGDEHTRGHLAAPTVMLVAAAADFNATLDRPRGVALLRQIADLLEEQRLADIPWGPKNKEHRPAIRALIDAKSHPKLDYDDGDDGMLSLMRILEREFGEAVDRLVDRFEHWADGAEEPLLLGFLIQFLIKRYAQVEEPGPAVGTIWHASIDAGLVQPD
jgi:hypothetical protein